MNRNWAFAVILPYWVVTCGCAAAVIGVGAAAGVGTAYVAGKDTRLYDADHRQAVQACLETLNSLRIPVSQTSADESKTKIQARRADGTAVSIEVVRAGPGRSEVGVRTGVVGITDVETSNRIHAALTDRLRLKGHEIARATGAPRSRKDDPEQPPEAPARRGPARRADEPSSISVAKRAPAELTVYFAPDSNELRPHEAAKLDKLAETIRQQPEARLVLNGYTDSVGPGDYNQMIAESRASSVKLYLVAKGVDPLRITVAGKGAEGFVAGNDSEEGRSLNRRVEILILPWFPPENSR